MRHTHLKIALFLSIFCSSQVTAGQFVNGFGVGMQYGGAVGWQGSYIFGQNKLKTGLGYFGLTLGYDRFFLPKTSFGVQYVANQFVIGAALNINYHFGSMPSRGWVAGAELFNGPNPVDSTEDILTGLTDFDGTLADTIIEEESRTGLSISVGYNF